MKLEVVNSQVSLVGKVKERAKIEATLAAFHEYLYDEPMCSGSVFDNSVESCGLIDIGFGYDQQDFTIATIKDMWKQFKKDNK